MSEKAIAPLILALACAALWFMPGPKGLAQDRVRSETAAVVEVDDSKLSLHGLVEYGTQYLKVKCADGTVRNAENEIRAQAELDKKFRVGDTALVVYPAEVTELAEIPADTVLIAKDHWRLGWAIGLFAAFAVLLVGFGGWTGAKALFSFVFSCFAVWKLLIPLVLSGHSAAWVSFGTVAVLTAVIMYLVAGWTRKGLAAFTGAMLGVLASLVLAFLTSALMHVNGMTMPYAPALLYSGYEFLDLADVFNGAVILASSGAVMDLAMDIAAGVGEVAHHCPKLPRKLLFISGIRIGRAVVGTMTTTLLLAYSGGYLTLLMTFAAQGTSPVDFLNSTLVSAEIAKTLVGSFGLVLVAPFTALMAAVITKAEIRR